MTRFATAAAVAAILCGCGGGDAPNVVPVTGKATVGGQPLTDCELTFVPKNPATGLYTGGWRGCTESFSSEHAGGLQFVMGDGRVLFISDNIQSNVWGAGLAAQLDDTNQAYNLSQNQVDIMGVYQKLGVVNDDGLVGEF